jgi:mannan endo-1,4-beta-mannosidase
MKGRWIVLAMASAMILPGLMACRPEKQVSQDFVTVKDGRFVAGEKPYYFIGTNFWYGAMLGSVGQGGDRARLGEELDLLKEAGVDNLRVLVGADGLSGPAVKVMPSLQLAPGVYNDTLFEGLDYLMAELGRRGMYAVLFINNSWEWSGGYGQYLEWAGKGTAPEEGVRNWHEFVEHVSQYADCEACKELNFEHERQVETRTNRYTG